MELGSGLKVPFDANIDFPSNYEAKHSRGVRSNEINTFPLMELTIEKEPCLPTTR